MCTLQSQLTSTNTIFAILKVFSIIHCMPSLVLKKKKYTKGMDKQILGLNLAEVGRKNVLFQLVKRTNINILRSVSRANLYSGSLCK